MAYLDTQYTQDGSSFTRLSPGDRLVVFALNHRLPNDPTELLKVGKSSELGGRAPRNFGSSGFDMGPAVG